MKRQIFIYNKHKEGDFERILARRKKIESYKENTEQKKQEKLQHAQALQSKQEEARRREELKKLHEENKENEKRRRQNEQVFFFIHAYNQIDPMNLGRIETQIECGKTSKIPISSILPTTGEGTWGRDIRNDGSRTAHPRKGMYKDLKLVAGKIASKKIFIRILL